MIKLVRMFMCLASLTACTQTDLMPATDLAGNWRLLTYCKTNTQPGTTGCTAVTVPADKSVIVSFANDSRFNETYQNTFPRDYAFLGCGGGNYEIRGKQVRIQAACMSSSNGQLFDLVSVDKTRLVINAGFLGDYVFERQ